METSFLDYMLGVVTKGVLSFMGPSRVPTMDGEFEIDGIDSDITIVRDQHGTPHITCGSRKDGLYALGNLHTTDRLWQMELFRRLSSGTMSEWFGEKALPTDRCARTLGFRRTAAIDLESYEKEYPEQLDLLKNYLRGINDRLADVLKSGKLPIEFSVVGKKPAPFVILDLLTFHRVLNVQMAYGSFRKLALWMLIDTVGEEAAAEINMENVSNGSGTVEIPRVGVDKAISDAIDAVNVVQTNLTDGASNAWVIGGERTNTGLPILANDTHLTMTAPCIFYPAHIKATDGSIHTYGLSIPLCPAALIGHNDHIGHGTTLAFTDAEDLFFEKFVSEDEYEHKGEIKKCKVTKEYINVSVVKEPVEHKVMYTVHGPIISNVFGFDPLKSKEFPETTKSLHIALGSVLLQSQPSLACFFQMETAANYEEFKAALADLKAPSLNMLFCDINGNYGRVHTGTIPTRPTKKCPTSIVEGWTGKNDWTGLVPASEMPYCKNPVEGYCATANSKLVGEDFPHDLGCMQRPAYRHKRILDLIDNCNRPITTDMCAEWQMDTLCYPGLELKVILPGFETNSTVLKEMVDIIKD